MPDPSAISSQIGTITLTAKIFAINVDMGIKYIALKPISGIVTYVGTVFILDSVGATIPSTPQTLTTFYKIDATNPIDGFTIDASAGSVELAILK